MPTTETDRVDTQVLRAIGVTSGLAGPRGFWVSFACFPKWISPDLSLPTAEREREARKDTRSKSAAGHGRGPAQHTAPASNWVQQFCPIQAPPTLTKSADPIEMDSFSRHPLLPLRSLGWSWQLIPGSKQTPWSWTVFSFFSKESQGGQVTPNPIRGTLPTLDRLLRFPQAQTQLS